VLKLSDMEEKLPVPDTLRNMFSTSGLPYSSHSALMDDSDQHEGRIRSFPHVRGNWASYAYINCKNQLDFYLTSFSNFELKTTFFLLSLRFCTQWAKTCGRNPNRGNETNGGSTF